MLLNAATVETVDSMEFHSLITVLFVFYGMEEMLTDACTLSRALFKDKWKQTLGDEHSGQQSMLRYRRMKEYHDEAKNRIFIAAAENGLA